VRLADTRDPNSLSSRLRRKRDVGLRKLIAAVAEERGGVTIIDMGGTAEYWKRLGVDFLQECGAKVTLVNKYATEIGASDDLGGVFKFEVGDACDLSSIEDLAFDLAHSNPVIEHVETWANMKAFAAETRRVASYYYVQTPYFWFPVDPHYYRMPLFHWLPRPTRARLLNAFPLAYSGRVTSVDLAYDIVDRARLLDDRQFAVLFPDADRSYEHFAGLRKSLIAVRGLAAS